MTETENLDFKAQSDKPKLFFLYRLPLALLFIGFSLGIYAAFKAFMRHLGLYDLMWGRTISVIVMLALVYLGYYWYLRIFEKRKPIEYSRKRWGRELGIGMAVGSGLITIQIIILWIMGIYHINEITLTRGILNILLISIITGSVEELLNKGIIFRLLEEGLGSWIALLIVALEVGITHVTNAGATVLSTIAVSIEFGIMLSLIFMITRRLWLVTGFHIAWNFTLGGIFGSNVSGLDAQGLISSNLHGHNLLTGGVFGIEATIPAITICSIITICLIYYVNKNNLVKKPIWRTA